MTDAAFPANTRALITPEGVDLRVRIASFGDRAIALIIDLLFLLLALIAMTFLVAGVIAATRTQSSGQWVAIVWLLGFFVLRNFYFTYFESSARAATPGKRIMGLRVASRNGGPLRIDSVFGRNAMRELELYMPISFLFSRGSEIGAVIVLCGIIWSAVFVLFPLFNRDRLRLGDIIAGTWVLKTPKQLLLPDLASEPAHAKFTFTEAQLDLYGVKELQVLESVLRQQNGAATEAVADRIRAKINWTRTNLEDDIDFLNAYYAALRRRLEQRLLFGVRKKDKHDQR